jgi:hypothetical protein
MLLHGIYRADYFPPGSGLLLNAKTFICRTKSGLKNTVSKSGPTAETEKL